MRHPRNATTLLRCVSCAAALMLAATAARAGDPVEVFLLAGQSNMAGRADDLGLPAALQLPQDDVLFYYGSSLTTLRPGSGTDFGPEITFGRTVADACSTDTFALIKHGTSGTSLSGDWDPSGGATYTAFRNKVTDGMAALTSAGYEPEIVGMLWTQGERDAKLGRTTPQYEADLNEFIADMRTNYGSGLPFYLSRLSSGQTDISAAGLTAIRTAQANVTAADSRAFMIDTDGFGLLGDNLHFNASGQQDLGNAFAAAHLGTGGGDPEAIARWDMNSGTGNTQDGWAGVGTGNVVVDNGITMTRGSTFSLTHRDRGTTGPLATDPLADLQRDFVTAPYANGDLSFDFAGLAHDTAYTVRAYAYDLNFDERKVQWKLPGGQVLGTVTMDNDNPSASYVDFPVTSSAAGEVSVLARGVPEGYGSADGNFWVNGIAITPGSGPDPDPDPDPPLAGIIAHYSFDTNFTDDSGNNNHLTIATGSPTITTTAGEVVYGGGALDVDSTTGTQEYLNLTTPIAFGATDTWSVAFWARRRPGTSIKSGMVIGNPGNKNDFIWLSNNSSQTQGLRFRNSSGGDADYDGYPDDNEFHHWAVIADGTGSVSVYRDDQPLGSRSLATTFSITSVAHAYNATTQSMDGQIDELYIFDNAIDAATVHSLYVPEPATLALLAMGGLAMVRRRRRATRGQARLAALA